MLPAEITALPLLVASTCDPSAATDQPPPDSVQLGTELPSASCSKLSVKSVEGVGEGLGFGEGLGLGLGFGSGAGDGEGEGEATGDGFGDGLGEAGLVTGEGDGDGACGALETAAAGLAAGLGLDCTAATGFGCGSTQGIQDTPLPAKGSQRGAPPASQTSEPGPRPNTKRMSRTASTVAVVAAKIRS